MDSESGAYNATSLRKVRSTVPVGLPATTTSDLTPFPTRPNNTTVLFAPVPEWDAASADALMVVTRTIKMTVPREGHTLPLAIGRDDAFRTGRPGRHPLARLQLSDCRLGPGRPRAGAEARRGG